MAVGLTDLDTDSDTGPICSSWLDQVLKSVIVIKISGLISCYVVFNQLDKLRIDRRDLCRSTEY